MTKVPIACTLTADAAVERMAEWQAVLSSAVQTVELCTHGAMLTLAPGDAAMVAVTELAEREKACCSFFQFSVEWDGVETRLHVSVPAEADPILADLLSFLPTQLRQAVVEDM